jgi:aspartyl protease family protein
VCGSLCLLASGACSHAASQVSVQGVFGEKALIAIGAGTARVMLAGESVQGVRLLEVRGQQVVIDDNGKRRTLQIGFGAAPFVASEPAAIAVISADSRGQFFVSGDINGHTLRFLVDTGASVIALPRSVAEKIGVSLHASRRVLVTTANGRARAGKVLLNSVRVGGVNANLVEAVILEDAQLALPLLGMSFLKRTNMKNEGDRLTLTQRY